VQANQRSPNRKIHFLIPAARGLRQTNLAAIPARRESFKTVSEFLDCFGVATFKLFFLADARIRQASTG